MDLPFSQACENNKKPILEQLNKQLSDSTLVFEIGTGTAQHAVFFAQNLPHLIWQTSDVEDYHFGIKLRLEVEGVANLKQPLIFKVGREKWPQTGADAIFTANTTHIMQPSEAKLMMQLVASNLGSDGVFCQYGPFNIDGEYTSESNRNFDQHLMQQGCGGIRDISQLEEWAGEAIYLAENIAMPANNRLLVWKKVKA